MRLMLSLSMDLKKLGHPEPESNLVEELKSGVPQLAHV